MSAMIYRATKNLCLVVYRAVKFCIMRTNILAKEERRHARNGPLHSHSLELVSVLDFHLFPGQIVFTSTHFVLKGEINWL